MKFKFLATMLLTLSLSAFGAGAGQLAKYLVNESGIMELLTKKGVDAVAAQRISKSVSNSLYNLGLDKGASGDSLKKLIATLGTTREEREIKRSLLSLLDAQGESLSKNDIVTAVNHLGTLASRRGVRGSLVAACTECIDDLLFNAGVKVSLQEISRDSVRKVLSSGVIPGSPRELKSYIKREMASLKFGDYSKVSKDFVSPEREKSLAIFLALAKKNSPASAEEKEFINSVIAISTRPDGSVNLLDDANKHSLWSTFGNDIMSNEDLAGFSAILREAAARGKDNVSKKDAFFDIMDETIGRASKEGQDGVNSLRLNKCIFN